MLSSNASSNFDRKDDEVDPLYELFRAHCRMDTVSRELDVELLPLTQLDVWFREAKIIDMKKVTLTDTGLNFFKFRKRAIDFEEFLQFLKNLSNERNLDVDDVMQNLTSCKKPIHPDDRKKKKARPQ